MMRHALFTTLLALLGAFALNTNYAQGGIFDGGFIKTGIKSGGYYPIYPYSYSMPFYARGYLTVTRYPRYYGGSSIYWQQQQQIPLPPFYGGSSDGVSGGMGGGLGGSLGAGLGGGLGGSLGGGAGGGSYGGSISG